MTDTTQPEVGSTHLIRYALELGLLWIDGDGRDKVREALDALDALEAKLASIVAGGVQALSAAPSGPWSLGEITGNWRDIDLPDHGAVMRIVWKMEDDEGRNEKLEAQAHAVVAALNAASLTPPAEQQAAPKAAPGERLTRNQIREVFMAHGFTIKEGQTDLKQYVYDAAHALLELVAAPQQEPAAYIHVPHHTVEGEVRPVVSFEKYQQDYADGIYSTRIPLYTAPQPAPAPLSDDVVMDAAFEPVRKKLCALPRFSFLSDGFGVRRVPDKSGSWIAFDAAHELFDPVAVDAALAAQGGRDAG